jgi:N-acetylmuramic acid 6-phosphate etherase
MATAAVKIEDREDFGARQLKDLGFEEGDLLLAITEGGETPFVIGACEASLKYSKQSPFFLYANPDETLKKVATRSKRVLSNSQIKKINLTHSPQALSGSTRLQASSVLMMAIGQALSCTLNDSSSQNTLFNLMIDQVSSLDMTKLSELTLFEEQCLESHQSVYYTGRPEHLISIFTDTTERSPTFSLTPFEHDEERSKDFHSANYLFLKDSSPESVWRQILGRTPRVLFWPEVTNVAGEERLRGYDFSSQVIEKRKPYFNSHEVIQVLKREDKLCFAFHQREITFPVSKSGQKFYDLLLEQLVIKLCLNAHSTLLMGRLGRYEGNLMTFVRPSNYKLIDRACRYAKILLQKRGVQKIDEEKLVKLCFEIGGSPGPVVLNLVRVYLDHLRE